MQVPYQRLGLMARCYEQGRCRGCSVARWLRFKQTPVTGIASTVVAASPGVRCHISAVGLLARCAGGHHGSRDSDCCRIQQAKWTGSGLRRLACVCCGISALGLKPNALAVPVVCRYSVLPSLRLAPAHRLEAQRAVSTTKSAPSISILVENDISALGLKPNALAVPQCQ